MREAEAGFLSSAFTDLMISLAVIFILLTVVFIREAAQRSVKDKEAVKEQLSDVLKRNKLPLSQDPADPLMMSVSVGENVLRFAINSSSVSQKGTEFLSQFVPDLTKQLCSEQIRSRVDAVIIEGHTDRSGEATAEGTRRNIRLSQSRSFAVLDQALESMKGDPMLSECFLSLVSATGRGSHSPLEVDGKYDPDLSRRVEIKIRVKSAEQGFFKSLIVDTGKPPEPP
jgi:outer membrane protein OmpA-like peptidoglycan-associated protein